MTHFHSAHFYSSNNDSFSTHSPKLSLNSQELDNVGMVEFAEVCDVRLLLFAHLLDGYPLPFEATPEDCSLSPGPQPLQVGYFLKRNLPVVRCLGKGWG